MERRRRSSVTSPETMQQVVFDGAGGPEVIHVAEAPVPQPGPGKVLIEVVAAGVNRPDCLQREGKYPPPPGESEVPGMEIAGHVVRLGEGVTGLRPGEAVCALLGSGGYAEYALADAPLCLPVPRGLSVIDAAGIPETYFTVFDNVFTRGRLKAGEWILIHGGSSGIGSTAIQLAKALGATVTVTAGSPEKCAFCRTLGADHAIDYKREDFVDAIRRIDKRGVDLILDMVGGTYIQKNLSILALEGRLVQIAFLQSSVVENFNFMPVLLKRLTLSGSTLRSRTLAQKAAVAAAVRENVWPLLEAGAVKPVVYATFPLEDARRAHALMESSGHVGKILLVSGKRR